MSLYRKLNIAVGWAVFLAAAAVYLATKEPSASFWDCSEFIVAAYKLQVPHPPGAPFYMLMSNFFIQLAGGHGAQAAVMVNALSALAGAFTILFLFWSITHLAQRLLLRSGNEPTLSQTIAIMGSGTVGALAYTFTDSFWFINVEADVYATSSLFTALVFWAILKWESISNQPHSNRWLILIAFIMGLSIGVHLLNLLTIPAIVFVYYFSKYKTSRWGVVAAAAVAVVLLFGIMYGIIPGIITLAAWSDLLFVNGFGLPFHSGVLAFVLILALSLGYGIWYTHTRGKVLANTILLCFTVIVIGYSSYTMLFIRANANTPMNQNNPSSAFSLLSYLNREQYGDRPLVTGQYYNAPVTASKDVLTYIKSDGRYRESYLKTVYEFDQNFTTLFPRMWSHREDHVREYRNWGGVKGRPIRISSPDGSSESTYVPTFGENLRFFFTYQMGYMYWRYFMWNFAGRQNDTQGHGDLLNGNWITGIKPLDAIRLGNQDKLTPEMLNHPSRNRYFLLPLLLGIVGLIFHSLRDQRNFWVVTLLFVMTGMAIVVYLNQTPLQPRERDYSYVGSFYAFSIWLGMGVLAIYEVLSRRLKGVLAASLATLIALSVPTLLAAENWDDHDRSGRYVARDFAKNYLNTCEPNAIIFTNGDNDTFPLWYAQEVQGVRTDVRVVNLSLLGTDWYIEQMKVQAYESAPLPINLEFDQFVQGTRDIIYIIDRVSKPLELKQVMDFVTSNRPETRFRTQAGEMIDFMPTRSISLAVDKEKVLSSGVVSPQDAHLIVDTLVWTIDREYLTKSDMIVLQIIANNNWERPIYFVSAGPDTDLGLTNYLQLEGFAYRLVPIKTEPADYLSLGRLNRDKLYDNFITNFEWGRMNQPEVFIDHNIQRTTLVLRLRNNFGRLAHELIDVGRKDSALVVLNRVMELMPHPKYPYDFFVIGIAEAYYRADDTESANELLASYAQYISSNLAYLFSLKGHFASVTSNERELNIQILQELANLAERYNQSELHSSINQGASYYHNLYIQEASGLHAR